jgi:hypothetical protein
MSNLCVCLITKYIFHFNSNFNHFSFKKPLSARKMNSDNDDDGGWLSKDCSGDKTKLEKLGVKIEEESSSSSGDESDSDDSMVSNRPMTREKYKQDKVSFWNSLN